MASQLPPQRIGLAAYLATRALDARSDATRHLLGAILRGEQQAVAFPRKTIPKPSHSLHVYRVIHEMLELKEECVLSQPEYVRELKNAARGLDANWKVLDQIVLINEPVLPPNQSTPKASPRRPIAEERGDVILDEIKRMNLDPKNLPSSAPGMGSIKADLKKILEDQLGRTSSGMSGSQFDRAWESLRKQEKIS